MAEYTYDEEGFNFYYFLLSVLLLCLVPTTGVLFYSGWKATKQNNSTDWCKCGSCVQERKKNDRVRSGNIVTQFTNPKIIFIVLGWLAVALLVYQVAQAEQPKARWDPYEILGLREGVELPEIKKVYKKLSLVYHPDKAQPGTERESEERFIEISKAYQVLTNDDARQNYEMFGHPDGKQSFTMGVALPKNLVEGTNSKFVLAFYALLFGLGLPYYIASWWYNSRRYTKDKILNATMAVFVKGLKENADFKELTKLLAGAYEFKENADQRPGEDKALKTIDVMITEELENRYGEKYERLNDTVPAYRRKARTLLYAYFLRLDINTKLSAGDANLLAKDQRFIVEKSIHLLQGLLQIAIVKQWLGIAVLTMDVQQHLMQATHPGDFSVKQLPYINNTVLRKFSKSKKSVQSVKQIVEMSESERKDLFKWVNEEQYLDIVEVANRVPKLSVRKAAFKVVGDQIVTTGAIITFVLKLKNGQAISVETEETVAEESDDEDLEETEENKNESRESLPLAHTPFYPGEKKPYWWIFLGDPKVNRILVPPSKVTDIVDTQTIRIPFAGPPKPGTYTFSLFVKSDTYSGTDIIQDINLTIQDPSDLPPEEDVDDSISEPEEDSIAGQMRMMREQGLASTLAGGSKQNNKGKGKADDNDDDDSSDSDDDSSDDE
ncbi:secretory subunit [Apophysomyces sp. BC1034]|nr:secretory subunit [Apophysomyces sp. BC1015]KAG0181429.1 secretory subunit [Apophysomyces sp. BC1021]KAG0191906.1 secretory subunit [Apophysomyces sp. BC1034]